MLKPDAKEVQRAKDGIRWQGEQWLKRGVNAALVRSMVEGEAKYHAWRLYQSHDCWRDFVPPEWRVED